MTGASQDRWPEDSFMADLPDAECTALLAAGESLRFEDEQIMLVQGDPGDFVYVLTGGLVKVIVEAASGAKTTLALRSRGDLLGEFALLDRKPRTATARAVGQVTAVKIGGTVFTDIISQSAAAQATLMRHLLSKMRSTTERRAAERIWEARERLAQVLYYLGRKHGLPGPDGSLRLPITQEELGDLAGVAVSTAERVLKELRKAGAVTTKYREITVKDMPYLNSIRYPQGKPEKPLPAGFFARPPSPGGPAPRGFPRVPVPLELRERRGVAPLPGRRQSRLSGRARRRPAKSGAREPPRAA